MAKSKRVVDPQDSEIDPRMAVLAALREMLPEGGSEDAAAPAPKAGAKAQGQAQAAATAKAGASEAAATTEAPAPAHASPADVDLQAALRHLEERAAQARRAAEAKKAEADRLRRRLGELARERDQLLAAVRRVRASIAWAGEEARPVLERAQARVSSIEEEMRGLRACIQELEADPGIGLIRAEEASKARAEQARQLAREGRLAEALAFLASSPPAQDSPLAAAREELMRQAHRAVEGVIFRAREALAAGAPERALEEIRGVAALLPHIRGEARRAAQGIFCRAVHRLVPAGQPLVLIRGRRVARRGRLVWTAPPGAIAIGTPTKGGARVAHNLGTHWTEGVFVPAEEADIQPLRARHGGQGQQDNAR